jgi:hypothetical protein
MIGLKATICLSGNAKKNRKVPLKTQSTVDNTSTKSHRLPQTKQTNKRRYVE